MCMYVTDCWYFSSTFFYRNADQVLKYDFAITKITLWAFRDLRYSNIM